MARRISIKAKPHDKNVNHGPQVPLSSMVGPFSATTTPSRVGPYKRESYRTKGRLLWSYWNGRTWGMMGSDFARACKRKDKPSKDQQRPWYGVAKA